MVQLMSRRVFTGCGCFLPDGIGIRVDKNKTDACASLIGYGIITPFSNTHDELELLCSDLNVVIQEYKMILAVDPEAIPTSKDADFNVYLMQVQKDHLESLKE